MISISMHGAECWTFHPANKKLAGCRKQKKFKTLLIATTHCASTYDAIKALYGSRKQMGPLSDLLLETAYSRAARRSLIGKRNSVLFNIRQLQAHTKTSTCQIHELQYADDCGVLAHSPDSMQHALNRSQHYITPLVSKSTPRKKKSRLNSHPLVPISIGLHSVLFISSPTWTPHSLQTLLLTVKFTTGLPKPHQLFGTTEKECLTVFKNLKISTNMAVYNAASVSTLLYGAETRTSYNATPYDATKTAWRFFTSDVSKKYSACPRKTG